MHKRMFRAILTVFDFDNPQVIAFRRNNLLRLVVYMLIPWLIFAIYSNDIIYPYSNADLAFSRKADGHVFPLFAEIAALIFVAGFTMLSAFSVDHATKRPFLFSGRFTVFSRGGYLLFSLTFGSLLFLVGGLLGYISTNLSFLIFYLSVIIWVAGGIYIIVIRTIVEVRLFCSLCGYRLKWFETADPDECPNCNASFLQ